MSFIENSVINYNIAYIIYIECHSGTVWVPIWHYRCAILALCMSGTGEIKTPTGTVSAILALIVPWGDFILYLFSAYRAEPY